MGKNVSERIKKLRKNKGFTLIELIVVIAILGILVLLAAPKFLGYTSDAKIAQIKNDIKTAENTIAVKLMRDPTLSENWPSIQNEEIEQKNADNSLWNKKGDIPNDYTFDGKYLDVPENILDEIKTKLPGNFIWDDEKEIVIYEEDGLSNLEDEGNQNDGNTPGGGDEGNAPGGDEGNTPGGENPPSTGDPSDSDGDGLKDDYETNVSKTDPNDPSDPKKNDDGTYELEDGSIIHPDGLIKHPDESVTLPDGTFVPVAATSEFFKDPNESNAYRYIGTKKSLVIPSAIANGNTRFDYMFYGKQIERVVLFDHTITSMINMFDSSKTYENNGVLDLTYFNTTGVTDMSNMFKGSIATTIDIRGFDTSSVSTMNAMFADSKAATILGLEDFNTEKVTTFGNMFYNASALTLDLSSFNTPSATSLSSMFDESKATKIDVSSFDTSKVTSISYMFRNSSVKDIALTSFDLSSVTSSKETFKGAALTGTQYARTQADADKLNATTSKPAGLTFIPKTQ